MSSPTTPVSTATFVMVPLCVAVPDEVPNAVILDVNSTSRPPRAMSPPIQTPALSSPFSPTTPVTTTTLLAAAVAVAVPVAAPSKLRSVNALAEALKAVTSLATNTPVEPKIGRVGLPATTPAKTIWLLAAADDVAVAVLPAGPLAAAAAADTAVASEAFTNSGSTP